MKIAVCIICLIMIGLGSNGQQLDGEWNGHFLFLNVSFTKTEIYFTISKISDTNIEGTCTTIVKNDTSVCFLKGRFLRKKKLFLEETGFIRGYTDTLRTKNSCLQQFTLFYRENKKGITLHGDYTTKTCGGGTVYLTKRL
jgi:hypothetical protein